MKIAILGWGSLVWAPRELEASKEWQKDGPCLPIEFARKSSGHRLTLVLYKNTEKVKTLWTYAKNEGLQEAISNLAKRENTRVSNIGFLFVPDDFYRCNVIPDMLPEIKVWAKQKQLDAVIWTDLAANIVPTIEEVMKYFDDLRENTTDAEEYVRRTPVQIKTKIRLLLEEKFGWTPLTEENNSRA